MRGLIFKELDAVNGGWAPWVLRLWKKVMCRESDGAANSLGGLNNYVRESTGANKLSYRDTDLTVGGRQPGSMF